MPRLACCDRCRADLVGIVEYITREGGSLVIGRRFVSDLSRKCRALASLPGTIGRARPELRPDIRSFAYKGYVILFGYKDDFFEVVNIIEGHRDIEALHAPERDED